jgi:hypothetical protein
MGAFALAALQFLNLALEDAGYLIRRRPYPR